MTSSKHSSSSVSSASSCSDESSAVSSAESPSDSSSGSSSSSDGWMRAFGEHHDGRSGKDIRTKVDIDPYDFF